MRHARSTPRGEEGFALVTVIAITTLLAVVAFIFTSSVRSFIRSAESDLATAEAEALADAGVNLALLTLIAPARLPPHRCRRHGDALHSG